MIINRLKESFSTVLFVSQQIVLRALSTQTALPALSTQRALLALLTPSAIPRLLIINLIYGSILILNNKIIKIIKLKKI